MISDITVFGTTVDAGDEANCLGTVTIPTRDHINAATATALVHTDWSFVPKGKFVNRSFIQGNILVFQRNAAVQRMMGDWLLFIDDDMVWDGQDIRRLVAARDEIDADILGGLCFRRAAPYQPTLFMREPSEGRYNYLEDWTDGVVEVDATGLAFALIHRRVFERIADSPMPPYKDRLAMEPPNFFRWVGKYSEDLQFCQDAKAAGCRIFVDTRIKIGHIGEHTIGEREFWTQMALRPPEMEAKRREINSRSGYPTLSREEAMRRIGLGPQS